jgi:hypothetical protein
MERPPLNRHCHATFTFGSILASDAAILFDAILRETEISRGTNGFLRPSIHLKKYEQPRVLKTLIEKEPWGRAWATGHDIRAVPSPSVYSGLPHCFIFFSSSLSLSLPLSLSLSRYLSTIQHASAWQNKQIYDHYSVVATPANTQNWTFGPFSSRLRNPLCQMDLRICADSLNIQAFTWQSHNYN